MTATTTPAQSGNHGEHGPAITQGVTDTTGAETGTVLEGIRHKVFLDRYARKGEDGTPLEQYPEQMWRRVAAGIAEVEATPEKRAEWTEKFAGLLSDFKFVPGGRILSGAGTGHQVTYYNCYVVGLGEDPLDPAAPRHPQLSPAEARPAFFNALTQMTDIMSRSGGVGMNLSSLPPRGTPIMEPGRGRAGAMRPTVALDLRHPDVVRLLDEKDGPNLAHLDVAVIVPPDFDEALAGDEDWTLRWEDRHGETLKARDLWARVTSDASSEASVEAGRSVGILRPDADMLRIADSRDAIVAGAAEVAARLYRGEGAVVDFSPLRPKGAYIKTVNGTSSGPVAWMYLIDAVAQLDDGATAGEKGVIWFGEIASTITGKTIQQGGSRRGALMLMLDDDHPDIEEFIKAKRIDPATNRPVMIEHANMSVCASDAFMAAVKADLPWDLKWQGKVVRTVRARHLWDLICTAAWTTAEPGLVFMERYQKRSNTYYFENIRCVNPCVTGDTLVYTAGGLYPAAELAETGAPITVTSAGEDGVSFKQASHVFPTGVKPVYRLQTKEGYTVRLTADHKVLTTRGWKEAHALTAADKIKLLNGEGGFGVSGNAEMGRVLGWLVGDGHITNRGKGQAAVILSFWGEDRALAESFREYITRAVGALEPRTGRTYDIGIVDVDGRDESRIRSIRLMRLIDPELIHNKLQVPPSVLRGSRSMQKGFLQAIFSADGTVNISGHAHAPTISIRLASSTRDLLTQIQQLLLNFGIACRLYKRRDAGSKALPDGKGGAMSYATAAQYELILGKENFVAFVREIGFLRESKQRKAEDILRQHPGECRREYFTATFESLTPDGEEAVYDLTEPESHLFVGNGILLHNCGEQGLPPGGVCNLGALNLERYVDADGALLEDDLARDAAYATRFLDNVIDATPYFSELHIAMQREGTRRTGLGTMGLADALIKMEVAYGSPESEDAIDRIYRVIRDSSYRASVELAREKGAFGRFERDKYLQGWFIQRLPEDVRDGIAEHGIRNGVLLTQAPTGTTSLLAGVSSGIEPVFDFAMKRVDRTGEHILYHPLYEAWRAAHPGEERPDFFVGAKDLTPEEHVVVQAKVQQYTDSSISKCVTGDTLVASERGLLPIRDLHAGEAPDTFRALSLRVASLGGEQTAAHFYYGGERPTLRVSLQDGRVITGTPNHRLYIGTAQGFVWKRLDELAPGDYVSVKIGAQIFGADVPLHGFVQSTTRAGYQKTINVPASMNPMLAHFVGAWCAEGNIDHYTVHITNNERPVLERLLREASALFGLEGGIAPQGKNKALGLHINSKSLCEFLRFLGCRDGAAHKVIPWSVLQSSRESVVAFLSGLYLDGYVTPGKVGITLATRELIDQLQFVLDNLGVQSWVSPKYNPRYDRYYYELNAHGQEGQKLARLLAFDEAHKTARVQALLQRTFQWSKSDVMPMDARHTVFATATRTVRYRHHGYSQALSGDQADRQLSWFGLRRLANDPDVPLTPALRETFEENLHFRQVVSVEDAGVREVYDLTIPSNHAFVANGIVNHNTANAPHDHTMEEVKRLYIQAYDLGCKGVTYYRDGSRDAVLTSVSESPRKAVAADKTPDDGAVAPAVAPPVLDAAVQPVGGPTLGIAETAPEPVEPVAPVGLELPSWLLDGTLKRRPAEMAGFTRNVSAPEGKVNITINSDADGPLELFINVGRAGSDVAALAEALGRLVSLQLRLPSTMSQEERLRQAANQLKGIGGSRSIGFGVNRVLSLPDAVAQAIYRHLEEHPAPPHRAADVPAAQLALPVAETSVAAPLAHPTPTPHDPAPASAPAHAGNGNGNGHANGNSNSAGTQLSLGAATPVAAASPVAVLTGNLCPQCGSSGAYVFEEGCKKCHYCGYSEC